MDQKLVGNLTGGCFSIFDAIKLYQVVNHADDSRPPHGKHGVQGTWAGEQGKTRATRNRATNHYRQGLLFPIKW